MADVRLRRTRSPDAALRPDRPLSVGPASVASARSLAWSFAVSEPGLGGTAGRVLALRPACCGLGGRVGAAAQRPLAGGRGSRPAPGRAGPAFFDSPFGARGPPWSAGVPGTPASVGEGAGRGCGGPRLSHSHAGDWPGRRLGFGYAGPASSHRLPLLQEGAAAGPGVAEQVLEAGPG